MNENPYQATPFEHTNHGPAPSTRPATATVFGILNLVFGAFGTCTTLVGALGIVAMQIPEVGEFLQKTKGMELLSNPAYQGYLVVSMIIGGGLTIVLVVSGIGLLKFKLWGRTAANFYAIPQIIFVFGNTAAQMIWFSGPAMSKYGESPAGTAEAIGTILSQLFGAFFSLVYPAILLYFVNRKEFVAALNQGLNN